MKKKVFFTLTIVLLLVNMPALIAAENTTIIAPTSEVAEGLDLQAVSELFAETKNLEDFEKALNNPNEGLNNIDLDGNGEVDYIRLVEQVADDTHMIILQATIGDDEFQDVATIEVEKNNTNYNMQIHGNEVIYGANYYYAPHVHIHAWPIITWMYRPHYRPYHSRFRYGFYPSWWRPFRPLHRSIYSKRVVRYTSRNTFVTRKVSRVRTINRITYKPRTSARVTKRVSVKRKLNSNGKTKAVKTTKRTVKRKNSQTTVKKKTTTKTKNGRKKTVKKTKVTKRNKR